MDASVLSAFEVTPVLAGWFDVILGNLKCYLPLLLLSGVVGWLLRHLFGGQNHEEELTGLRRRLTTHESTLSTLTSNLSASQTGRATLEGEVSGLKGKLSQLTTDLTAAKSGCATLEATLRTRDGELADCRNRFLLLQKELESSKTQHSSLTGEIARLTAAAGATALAVKTAESGQRTHEAELVRLRQDLAAAAAAKTAKELELNKVVAAHATLETSFKQRETELQAVKTNYARLQADHEAAKTHHSSLTAEVSKLTAAAGAAALAVKAADTGKQSHELELARLRNELATVVTARAEKEQDLTATLNQRGLDLSQALSVRTGLESSLQQRETDLQSHKSSHARLLAELEAAKAHQGSLTAEIAKLTAAAGAAVLAVKAADAGKHSHEVELARLRKEVATTATAKAEKELDLTATLNQRGLDLSQALSRRGGLESTLQQRETELHGHKSAHAKLQSELDAAKVQHGNQAAEVARLAAAAQALEAEKSSLHTALQSARTDLGRHADEAGTLRTQLTQAHAEKSRLAAEIPPARVQVAACPQRLADVHGIGSVYEQRLYQAGIGTFSELAALAPDTLVKLLELNDPQKAAFDFAKVRADAQRLARETNSIGRRWSGSAPDDLEPLEGIGAAFEKRLYDAGICTYEALCSGSPELLAEIVNAADHLKPDFARWIAQGCQLARKRAVLAKYGSKLRDPNDESPYATNCPQHLSDVKGIGTVFETRLYEGGIGTFWDLSNLSRERIIQLLSLDERLQQSFPFEEMKADAIRLANETKSKGRTWRRNPPDDLEPIHGIGYTYEKRLYDAGFCTYESVCEATPEVLHEICLGPKHNQPEYASWISQACTLAQRKARGESVGQAKAAAPRGADDESPYTTRCPQHLSDVVGIGTVFESRLYANGVGTYWDLSKVTNADFTRFLELTPRQQETFDADATRADALRLARETKSKGRRWDSEPPDDLEPLEGIGHTYEKRLYDAGICTYAELAKASVEQLNQICRPPAHNLPDFANWIAQAKALTQRG